MSRRWPRRHASYTARADSVSLRSAGREALRGSQRRRLETRTWMACLADAWWANTGGAARSSEVPGRAHLLESTKTGTD
eukprot:4594828-Pyramimonas_sp.AAC.1